MSNKDHSTKAIPIAPELLPVLPELIISSFNDLITIHDQSGKFTFVSPSSLQILGYQSDFLIGKHPGDFAHIEDTQKISSHFNDSFKSGEAEPYITFRAKAKSSDYIWLEGSSSRIRGKDGQEMLLMVSRDVTSEINSVHRRKPIVDTNPLFREIFLHVAEGIAVLDKSGRFIMQNPAHEDIFGYTLDEIRWKTPSFMTGEKIFSEIFKVFDYLGHFTGELSMKTKSGESIMAELTFLRLESEHLPESVVAIVRDISKLKKVQKDLKQAKRKAEEANRMKTAFLSNMSHEIRTPMNAILGFSSLLEEENLPKDKRTEYLNIINTNGKNLLNLISDILDMAKIESGYLKIVERPCSLMEIMDNLEAIIQEELNRIKKKEVSVIRKTPYDPGIIMTDSFRLHQVLVNLLSNAIKFTDKGKIEFGFSIENNEWILFYVNDTGRGIPPERLEKIFERFERADAHSASNIEGTGLGLAISKQLTELLGGKIWVESTPDKGSAFYFSIPYRPVDAEEKKEILINDIKTGQLKNKRVLIVEDDTGSFELINNILSPTGLELIHLDSGGKAIEFLKKEHNIDMIIMDVRLPDVNGLEIVKRLRSERSTIPIVAYTANAMQKDISQAYKSGVNDIILKPLKKQDVLEKIHKYLLKQ